MLIKVILAVTIIGLTIYEIISIVKVVKTNKQINKVRSNTPDNKIDNNLKEDKISGGNSNCS